MAKRERVPQDEHNNRQLQQGNDNESVSAGGEGGGGLDPMQYLKLQEEGKMENFVSPVQENNAEEQGGAQENKAPKAKNLNAPAGVMPAVNSNALEEEGVQNNKGKVLTSDGLEYD